MTVPGYPAFNESLRQPPLGPGEVLVGKYRVEQVIGAGAMGVVVLAWHIELEQQVAIKFLYPEFAANAHGAERFRREARAAVRIQNEHVARVLDVGTLDGRDGQGPSVPFIVMEYLEGRDLARELKERRTLPPHEAVAHVRQACEAVAEAHSLGIVHRDLKPANLFLSQRPSGARLIKVLDFGISKLVTGTPQRLSITDTSILLGSPAYMSPEQLECSRSVDGRADVWSLGVILYELIAGRLPFNGDSVPQLIRSVVTGARVPLVGDDARLAHLEPIVARCLAQERAHRFQSVRELSAALDAAMRVDPASPPIELARTSAAQFEPAPALEIPDASPSAAVEPAPAAEHTRPGADGAWGRTHGARAGAWHRRGIPLVALLALIGLGGVWGVRSERRAADARAAARRAGVALSPPSSAPQPERTGTTERVVAELTPAPQIAPVPTPEPVVAAPASAAPASSAPAVAVPAAAPTPPVVPAPARPTAATALAGAAPVVAGAAAPPPPAPAPAAAPASTASAPALSAPAAGETRAPNAAAEPPPVATPPVVATPPGAPREVAAPHDSRFEIPEFGGRE